MRPISGEEAPGRWIVSCAALNGTNLLGSGSYDDCIRLWDANVENREKDGELLKAVRSIPIVGPGVACCVEGVRELAVVRAVGPVCGGGDRAGASDGALVATEGREERDFHPELES